MQSVDIFILLDSVQFARRSWQQRNQIKTPNGPIWLTVPVESKGKREQKIADVKIENSSSHANRHSRAIINNYTKAKYFKQYSPSLLNQISKSESYLAELNINLIEHCRTILGIKTTLMRSSEMKSSGVKADLLASLCEEVHGSEYVAPPGSREYLIESNSFKRADIPVRYFDFVHPTYQQLFGDFLPYMSVIDLILNCGDQSESIIFSGNQVVD